MSKYCPKCETVLPKDAFAKHSQRHDGLQSCCRACKKGYQKHQLHRLNIPADYDGAICCQICGIAKPATEFYLTRNQRRCAYCKACHYLKCKAWQVAHPGAMRRYNVRWIARHPEVTSRYNARRRARLQNALRLEPICLDILYKRDKGICGICFKYVPRKQASRDHIIPLTHGGDHTYANVVLAHLSCNSSKGNRLVLQQMRLF